MTDQQKSLERVAARVEANHIKYIRVHYNALTPRLKRLLRALLDNPAGLSREECDRATPCSNSPEYVSQLRDRLALAIPCEHVRFTTADGVASWYGRYYLTRTDRERLTAALS
jgi:hypothetical protein